jgi:hypothetical protein
MIFHFSISKENSGQPTHLVCGKSVRDENYSHLILSTFQADFHLDFLSKYIAEEVIAKMETDSLETLSAFLVRDDSESTAVIRGRIYEMFCHRRFRLSQAFVLNYRSLDSVASKITLDIPNDLEAEASKSFLRRNSGFPSIA